MAQQEQIIIEVDINAGQVAERLGQVNAEMAALRQQQTELKKEIREGNDEFGKNSKALAENEQRLYDLKREATALSGQLQQNVTANKKYGDSIKEQAGLLKSLKDQWQSLSKSQRESAEGMQLQQRIQDLDAEIKGADASIGNYQRNVGNYSNSIAKIAGLFGGATSAAKNMQGGVVGVANGLRAMSGIPIVAIIGAIIAIFDKLKAALRGNEEQQMRVNEVMAALRPLMDAVNNGISVLADALIWLTEKAVKVGTKALEGLAKAADWVGRLFGADWGLEEKTRQLEQQAEAQRELAKAENDYAKSKRDFVVEEAENEQKIAELRAKVAEKDKYNSKERKAYLDEAIKVEERNAQRKKELAEENLRILQAEAARTANDAETNDKLAQAEAEVIKAETELANKKRELNAQSAELARTIRQEEITAYNASIEKLKQYREEVGKLIDELPSLADAQEATEKEATEKVKKAYDDQSAAIEALREEYESASVDFSKYEQATDVMGDVSERQASLLERLQHAWSKYGGVIGDTAGQIGESFGSIGDMYQQVADDESRSEEERARAARSAKAFAVAQLASNSAVALSKSIAAAADVPWPANLASIASSVAAVLSFVAQAKALLSDADGFETGGIIGGVHGATMGHDNTVIKARYGEQVINAQGQRTLLDVVSGMTMTESTTTAIARALASMPAPVLDYREFTDFGERVATMREVQTIR